MRPPLLPRFTCLLFASLILCLGLLTFALPPRSFSETENRTLAAFPVPSPRAIASGAFSRGIANFAADHVPLRLRLLEIRSMGEFLLGRRESGGTFLAKDGHLIKRLELADTAPLAQNLADIATLEKRLQEIGIPTVFVCAPRAIDVFADRLPAHYPRDGAATLKVLLDCHTPSAYFPIETLRTRAQAGEAVWFRTDHHWTPLGAYYIYEEIAPRLGITPYAEDAFTRTVLSRTFLGTSASSALFPLAKGETLFCYRFAGDDTLTVTDMQTGERHRGLYRMEHLETRDKYAVFLGGNFAHLRVEGDGARPRLLLIKDSFANCLVPFLARHFDIDLVDVRYLRGDGDALLHDLAREREFDATLFLFGAETLATGPLFGNFY